MERWNSWEDRKAGGLGGRRAKLFIQEAGALAIAVCHQEIQLPHPRVFWIALGRLFQSADRIFIPAGAIEKLGQFKQGQAEFFGLGLDHDTRLPELLRAVTLDEANAEARRILDPDRATVVIAGPYQE